MALYTYACDTCDFTVERREKISDPPEPMPCNVAQAYHQATRRGREEETEDERNAGANEFWRLLMDDSCPGEVTRQIGVPAIRFKGSGFYETDYKRK